MFNRIKNRVLSIMDRASSSNLSSHTLFDFLSILTTGFFDFVFKVFLIFLNFNLNTAKLLIAKSIQKMLDWVFYINEEKRFHRYLFKRLAFLPCLALVFGLSLNSLKLNAQQVAPVLANVQVNPPYSSYLSDYSSPGSDKLQVNLFLKDLTKTNYPCRLRIKLEGFGITIQSKNDFYAPSLFLNGGELSVFSGADLEPYFNPQNLVFSGLNESEFTRNGSKLPEGIYRLTVEVIDYYRKNLVSNSGSTVISIFLSYPPIINVPFNLSKVSQIEHQNVLFQWTPRHTASLNAAYNVAYNFKLVEMIPANRDPNDAIRSTRPLYETFTDQTMLVYGLAEPALTPGSNYAVQVQAVEAEGRDLFVNGGRSEVVKFTYGDKCASPVSVFGELSGLNAIKVSWTSLPEHQAFTIRYREANKTTAQWFEQEVFTPSYLIQGLRSSTAYEFQVKAQCIYGYGEYSALQSFQVPDEALTQGDFVCGKEENLPQPDKSTSIDLLRKDMVFFAGFFPIQVTEVSGSNGMFSGKGTVGVPLLNALSFQVIFTNVRINSNLKLVDGKVSFARQELQQSIDKVIAAITVKPDADGNVDAISSNGLPTILDAAITWPGEMPKYNALTKTVTFKATVTGDKAAKEITMKLKDGQPPIVFQDKNQETFQVDKDGVVTNLGKIPPSQLLAGGGKTSLALNTEKASIEFMAPNQKYGLDNYNKSLGENANYKAAYQNLADANKNNTPYYVGWKSIESKQVEEIRAKISLTDLSLDKSKVEFKTGTGEKLSATFMNGIYTINTIGALPGNAKEIYAYHPNAAVGGAYIGKLNVDAFNKVTKKVVLVPVNGNGINLDRLAVKAELNKIYQQAVVEWDVELANNFDSKNLAFDHLETANSTMMSAYTDGQKDLVNAYRQNHILESGTYYIFLVKGLSDGSAGYMVRGGQVGFVGITQALSKKEGGIGRTIAHELGHGAFMLQHTWDVPGLYKNSTNNLMDYAGGTELWYSQWKYMRNPDVIFRPWEGDDEGAYLGSNYFVAINGYPIKIEDVDIKSLTVSTNYPTGSISGYTNKQGKVFNAVFKNGVFIGYGNDRDTIKITRPTEKLLKVQFIEPTIDDCIYKISVGDYIVPSEISGLVASRIEMPAKRDKSTTMTRLSCITQNLADESYIGKKYLDALSGNVGKGNDSGLPKPSDGSSVMFDYAQTLSVKEKQKVIEQLKFINENDGIKGRIYITDYLTAKEIKQEIQTYIDNLRGKEIALWIDFDSNKKPTIQLKVSSDIEGARNISTLAYIEKLKERAWYQVIDANWQMDFNPLTAVLDGVAGLIGKLSIPERFYNPSAQNYNSLPATIYAVASLGIIGDELSSILTKNNPYNDKFSHTRCDFALTCGVWNGLVGTLEGIPSGISGLVKISGSVIDVIVDQDGARTKFAKTIKSINWTSISELSKGIGAEIGKGWAKSTENPCMIAYSSGQAVFVVLSYYIGVGEANAAKTFLQALDKLDLAGSLIGKITKFGGVLIKPIIGEIGKGLKYAIEKGGILVKDIKISKLGNKLSLLVPNLASNSQISETFKKAYEKLKRLTKTDLGSRLERAELLTDDAGNLIKDEYGNVFANVEVDGEKIPVIIGDENAIKKADNLANEIGSLLNAFDELKLFLKDKGIDLADDANGLSKSFVDVNGNFKQTGSSFFETPITTGGNKQIVVTSPKATALSVKTKPELLADYDVSSQKAIKYIEGTNAEFASKVQNAENATLKILTNKAGKQAVLLETSTDLRLLRAAEELASQIKAKEKEVEEKEKKCTLCNTEPLICTLQKKATFAQKDAALTKLCQQLTITNLKPVAIKLNTFTVSDLNDFLTDVLNVPATCNGSSAVEQPLYSSVGKLNLPMVKAWSIYNVANRTCLRNSITHDESLGQALDNQTLRSTAYGMQDADFKEMAVVAKDQRGLTGNLDDEEFVNLNNFGNKNYQVANFNRILANLKKTDVFYTPVGANWVIKYMANNSAEFAGKTISFEEAVTFDDDGKRVADVVLNPLGDDPIFYEFKSVKAIEDKYIIQFIKDLSFDKVTSLSQIQWRFDHDKISLAEVKIKFLAGLNVNKKSLESVGINKIRILFPQNTSQINDDNFADFLIAKLNDDAIFQTIFR